MESWEDQGRGEWVPWVTGIPQRWCQTTRFCLVSSWKRFLFWCTTHKKCLRDSIIVKAGQDLWDDQVQPSIYHHHKPCPPVPHPGFWTFEGWWFHHCPRLPVPVPDHHSSEEIFPNIQAKCYFWIRQTDVLQLEQDRVFPAGISLGVRASSQCMSLWEARLPTKLAGRRTQVRKQKCSRSGVTLHATHSSKISSGLYSHVTPGFLTSLFSSKQPFVLKQTTPNTPIIRTSSEGHYAFLNKCSIIIVDKSFHFPSYFFLIATSSHQFHLLSCK